MPDGIALAMVARFPLTVHWSVLMILWLFTWSLATTLRATAQRRTAVPFAMSSARRRAGRPPRTKCCSRQAPFQRRSGAVDQRKPARVCSQ